MNQTRIATQRTVQPFAVTAIATEIVRRATGVELTAAEAVAVTGAVFTVAYRVGRELERRWPWLGRILFGSAATPTYTTPKEG